MKGGWNVSLRGTRIKQSCNIHGFTNVINHQITKMVKIILHWADWKLLLYLHYNPRKYQQIICHWNEEKKIAHKPVDRGFVGSFLNCHVLCAMFTEERVKESQTTQWQQKFESVDKRHEFSFLSRYNILILLTNISSIHNTDAKKRRIRREIGLLHYWELPLSFTYVKDSLCYSRPNGVLDN